jgi:hypothetical protein
MIDKQLNLNLNITEIHTPLLGILAEWLRCPTQRLGQAAKADERM